MARILPLRVLMGVMLPCPQKRGHEIAHCKPLVWSMLRRRKCSLGSKERNSLCFHQAGTFQSKAGILCIPSAKAVLALGAKILCTWGRRCYFVWPHSPLSPRKLQNLKLRCSSKKLRKRQNLLEGRRPCRRWASSNLPGCSAPPQPLGKDIADPPTSQPQAAWASCVQALGRGNCCFSALSGCCGAWR